MLKDRVALITGASRGMGAATARLLAAHGATVAINYLSNREAGERVVNEIQQNGGRALLLQGDVTVQSEAERVVRQAQQELGPIDILVLNANIPFVQKPFLDFPWEEFQHKVTSELKAAYFCSQVVAAGMKERKRGSIIAMSSGAARRPREGAVAHAVAKAAVEAFVRVLAVELGPSNIRVNAVAPGFTRTDATAGFPEHLREAITAGTPMGRVAEPGDIAQAILALAGGCMGFVTGICLPVDGGVHLV
jgi:3-oxoacyl-[acyl-carrier protein] reductase